MAPRSLAHKPGAERTFRPDVIETYHTDIEQGDTLLPLLFRVMPQRKRTNVKELLRHGQVAVNGVPVTRHDTPVTPSDKVEVNITRQFQVFSHKRVKLVYEDDYVIVVNKGYGLLSVGTGSPADANKESAYSIVRDYIKRKNPKNKLFIVHRLDRDTSGLLMFAKSEEAMDTMRHNWYNLVLERKYIAVVEGALDPEQGRYESYLAENSQYEVYSTDNHEEGKRAITSYRTLRKGSRYSMVEVELETGRKNQIRVHMHDLGHPIAGDRKYGAATSPIHRLALHAKTLRFVHPVTRRDMNFTSAIPDGFSSMVK